MKPSDNKKTSSHDDFIKKYYSQVEKIKKTIIEENPNKTIQVYSEFEKPIFTQSGYLIGVADHVLTVHKENKVYQKIITEFKPNCEDISASVRQLKSYQHYKFAEDRLVFCTYKSKVTEDALLILSITGIQIATIED